MHNSRDRRIQINTSTFGFDKLFDRADQLSDLYTGYPPYSILQLTNTTEEPHSDRAWEIVLAVAGFKEDDIEIYREKDHIFVKGNVGERLTDRAHNVVHAGIAQRNFHLKFAIVDTIHINDVTLADGLLTIKLREVTPKEKKPVKIEINSTPTLGQDGVEGGTIESKDTPDTS